MHTSNDNEKMISNHRAQEVTNRNIVLYFLLLVLFSIPIWLIGLFFGNRLPLPIKLPTSVFVIFIPAVTASILSFKQSGWHGLKELWKKVFDFYKIKNKNWLWVALISMPLIHFLSYLWLRWSGGPLPDEIIFPIQMLPLFFVLFFIGAIFEELGWSGYIYDPLENRWGALKASLFIDAVWALWHFIGDLQVGNPAIWIFFHRLSTVALRMIIVWIYNNSGKSVFTTILVHDMVNVSDFMFPNYGSHYDPISSFVLYGILVAVALIGWGTKTMAEYRFASVGR